MRIQILAFTLLLGILGAQAIESKGKGEGIASNDAIDASSAASAPVAAAEAPKDKRQVGNKETSLYPNHRSDGNGAIGPIAAAAASGDDPEDAQETIYGTKPNQFIIRPIAPHQHQQHESHQEPQLRNYAAANPRPHAAQLLEQSQEVPHYVYLQDIMRHHQSSPKALVAAGQGKGGNAGTSVAKKPLDNAPAPVEEAEQRYAVAIQPRPRPYATGPYQLPLPVPAPQHQHAQLQQQAQQQQPYQVIPEEQFLKLLEEELQARAFHEAQLRHHHQQQQQQQQHQQQHQQHQQHQQQQQVAPASKSLPIHSTAATHKVLQQAEPGLGLGSYRERVVAEQELVSPQYLSYQRNGPKYLPRQPPPPQVHPSAATQEEEEPLPTPQRHLSAHAAHHQHAIDALPPQIAYYQPQISYKTLPNHPLAKSSLESEIEKLLAANKHSALEYVDTSNEPTLVSAQHQHVRGPQPPPPPPSPTSAHAALRQSKTYIANTTPNSLLDANNQPFIPSLFKFSQFQQPTPIYPTQVPQHLIEAKKLGPVVYPPSTPQPVQQPSQYYYHETAPTPKPKPYRPKHYGHKLGGGPVGPAATKSYEKAALIYDYDRPQPPSNFYPSPPDPIKHTQRTSPLPTPTAVPHVPTDYPQYVLPASPAPSQSSIYVSQGTGIATPSRINGVAAATPAHKLRTVDEVKQLNLPPPNGKPLTQAEFQALVDAGYPVKAVPVPVPVPYEQYVKDHPEYRNHPPVDYAHLMRLATRQLSQHHRSLAAPSEPSVKIVSSPSEPQQTATAIGGGSVTYLQPIEVGLNAQKRRPRDEQDTAVAGSNPSISSSSKEAQTKTKTQ